jgi:hypothetical protein
MQLAKIENGLSVEVLDTDCVYGDLTLSDIKSSNVYNKEVIIAKYGEKQIKDLDANFSGEKLKAIINLTIFESGFKIENISEIIIMVIKDIFSDFSFMTLSEVSLSFRKGVRGELGDFMGLSVRTFYFWLKQYNQYKLDYLKQLQNIKKEEPPVSEEKKKEVRRIWLKTFVDDFEQYKKTKVSEVMDFRNMFYDYCVEKAAWMGVS